MTRLFQTASVVAVALTAATAILIGVPSMAQERPGDVVFEPAIAAPATQADPIAAPSAVPADTANDNDAVSEDNAPAAATSLRQAMTIATRDGDNDRELHCVAVGVYFESQGEPLEGQLAVAHVILNRAQSGRFASTPCGVLTQRGQFSFVRGGALPTPPQNQNWRTAQAIARVAMENRWRNPAPGAMYFHATRVSPSWNRQRIARLGNHIFYR